MIRTCAAILVSGQRRGQRCGRQTVSKLADGRPACQRHRHVAPAAPVDALDNTARACIVRLFKRGESIGSLARRHFVTTDDIDQIIRDAAKRESEQEPRRCRQCHRSEPEVQFGKWQHRCTECREGWSRVEARCGLCRQRGHDTAACPLKREKIAKVCQVCAGLPHRVPGLRCVCGLRRGSEAPLHAVNFGGIRSEPTYPEGPPRLSRHDVVQVGQRMDQIVDHVRRAAHTGEVVPLASNVVNPFFKDELGNRYGSFLVVARCPNTASQARWVLRCELCQTEMRVNGASLRAGKRMGRSVKCAECAKAKVRVG